MGEHTTLVALRLYSGPAQHEAGGIELRTKGQGKGQRANTGKERSAFGTSLSLLMVMNELSVQQTHVSEHN